MVVAIFIYGNESGRRVHATAGMRHRTRIVKTWTELRKFVQGVVPLKHRASSIEFLKHAMR